MNRKLAASVLPALLFASFIASAQTPPAEETTPPSTAAQQNQKDPNDPSKGQDLVGDKQPAPQSAVKSPPTVGQDKSSGNNLVGDNKGMMQNSSMAGQADFQTLDVKKRGYLMASDVSQQPWLKQNFSKCDANGDGHLTQPEYAACAKK
jgi:hypothetical protein